MKRLIILGIAALLLLAPKAKAQSRYSATFFDYFDTITEITGYAESEKAFNEKAEKIEAELRRYHILFDIYNNYDGINNLKTINDNAGAIPVKVDEEIIELLVFSKHLNEETGGKTNIAMGSVLRLWHKARESSVLPDENLLFEAAKHTDINDIIINKENSTVYVADSKTSLDVGAVAKGFAVQKITDYARSLGFERLIISVGGNVSVIGSKDENTPWVVGITNPFDDGKAYIDMVQAEDISVVTSGDYERYFEADGKRYCHIIDPETLTSADNFASVTVICDNSALADAYSTALFTMSLQEGQEFIAEMNAKAIWVTKSGDVHYSWDFAP